MMTVRELVTVSALSLKRIWDTVQQHVEGCLLPLGFLQFELRDNKVAEYVSPDKKYTVQLFLSYKGFYHLMVEHWPAGDPPRP